MFLSINRAYILCPIWRYSCKLCVLILKIFFLIKVWHVDKELSFHKGMDAWFFYPDKAISVGFSVTPIIPQFYEIFWLFQLKLAQNYQILIVYRAFVMVYWLWMFCFCLLLLHTLERISHSISRIRTIITVKPRWTITQYFPFLLLLSSKYSFIRQLIQFTWTEWACLHVAPFTRWVLFQNKLKYYQSFKLITHKFSSLDGAFCTLKHTM